MNLIIYPNDILRQQCYSVEKITPELVQLAQDMYKLMVQCNGLGISAPQVGQAIRLIVLENNGKPLIMFNPKILKFSKEKVIFNEGCLSFPDKFVNIKRSNEIDVKYRDINNKMQFSKFSGVLARAIIHECCHLNGQLLIDFEENT